MSSICMTLSDDRVHLLCAVCGEHDAFPQGEPFVAACRRFTAQHRHQDRRVDVEAGAA